MVPYVAMQEILVGIVAVAAVFWLLSAMERRSSVATLGLVLASVVIESFLFENQGTSSGIFYLGVGSENLRLAQVLIPLALLARWRIRGFSKRISGAGALWLLFFAWYATCLVIGLINGNDSTEALFEAKSIIYVGGGYLLAAGAAAELLVTRRNVARWIVPLSILVLVVLPTSFSDTPWGLSASPLFDESSFGFLAADATTILTVIGLVALVIEMCRPRPRLLVSLACIPLLLTPIAGDQRASFLCLGVGVLGLAIAMLGRTGAVRFTIRRERVAVAALALVGIGIVSTAIIIGQGGANPVTQRFDILNNNPSKDASVRARESLFDQAVNLIEQEPGFGHGLGKQPRLTAQPFGQPDLDASSHNLFLDLWIRGGIPAVLFFLAALIASLRMALRTWRRSDDALLAALALGTGLGALMFMAKAMVEPTLEQFKLATLFGLLLGVITAAAQSRARPALADEIENTPPVASKGQRIGIGAGLGTQPRSATGPRLVNPRPRSRSPSS